MAKPILVELIDLVNSTITFNHNHNSHDLSQMFSFPTWIPDCYSHNHALLDFFLYSDASICSILALSPLGNSDHVVVSVSIDFPSNSQQDAPFHYIAYDYSCADWCSIRDFCC